MDVLGTQNQGLFTGSKGRIELPQAEMDFSLGQPSLEAAGIHGDSLFKLRQRRTFVAHGEIKRRCLRQSQGSLRWR